MDVRDAAVTELDEMLDGEPGAGGVVGADDVDLGAAHCPRHDDDGDTRGQRLQVDAVETGPPAPAPRSEGSRAGLRGLRCLAGRRSARLAHGASAEDPR